jgi:hypothetical protein
MTTQARQREKVQRFERLAARAQEIYEAGSERSAEALDKALSEARKKLEAAGELGREEGESLEAWLRRDLQLARLRASSLKETIGSGLDPSRLGSAFLGLAATVMNSTSATLKEWAAKADVATTYRTGEITGPGTLTCRSCGSELRMRSSSRIPPCPKCSETEFRKSY